MIIDHNEWGDSGPLYRVTEIAGRPPTSLDDLIGATTVTVETDDHEYRLIGTGVKRDQIVAVSPKEPDRLLIPVWCGRWATPTTSASPPRRTVGD